MATFEVTLKNGHTYEIEAPEDSTDEFLRDKAQKFDVEDNPEYDYTTQAVKSGLKGLTYGWNEEIEAKMKTNQSFAKSLERSDEYKAAYQEYKKLPAYHNRNEQQTIRATELTNLMSSENDALKAEQNAKYIAERDKLRTKHEAFARDNPKTALALEVAGGLVVPGGAAKAGVNIAKQGLKQGFKTSAKQGFVAGGAYGSGNALETEDIVGDTVKQGALGSAFGGALNTVGKVAAPRIADATKKMMNKGVDLTYGSIFPALNKFEQYAGNIIPGIHTARQKAQAQWNRSIAEDVLTPLGEKVPSHLTSNNTIANFIRETVDKSYASAYKGLNLKATNELVNDLNTMVSKSMLRGPALKGLQQEVKQTISLIKQGRGNTGLNGQRVKDLFKNLGKRQKAYAKSTDVNKSPLFEETKDIVQIIKNNLKLQNGAKAQKLFDTDAAYGKVVAFEGATAKAIKNKDQVGVFNPNQLIDAANDGASKASRRINNATLRGDVINDATKAKALNLEANVGNSGTGGTGLAAAALTGFASPATLVPLVGTYLAYRPGTLKLFNKYVQGGGKPEKFRAFMEKYNAAGTTGLLNTQKDNEGADRALENTGAGLNIAVDAYTDELPVVNSLGPQIVNGLIN